MKAGWTHGQRQFLLVHFSSEIYFFEINGRHTTTKLPRRPHPWYVCSLLTFFLLLLAFWWKGLRALKLIEFCLRTKEVPLAIIYDIHNKNSLKVEISWTSTAYSRANPKYYAVCTTICSTFLRSTTRLWKATKSNLFEMKANFFHLRLYTQAILRANRCCLFWAEVFKHSNAHK